MAGQGQFLFPLTRFTWRVLTELLKAQAHDSQALRLPRLPPGAGLQPPGVARGALRPWRLARRSAGPPRARFGNPWRRLRDTARNRSRAQGGLASPPAPPRVLWLPAPGLRALHHGHRSQEPGPVRGAGRWAVGWGRAVAREAAIVAIVEIVAIVAIVPGAPQS